MAKRKPVWNTDTWTKSFYERDAKGTTIAYHSVLPGESTLLPKHERDRLLKDGGWTETNPDQKAPLDEPKAVMVGPDTSTTMDTATATVTGSEDKEVD